MRSYWKKSVNLLKDFAIYFHKGWQTGLIGQYIRLFMKSFLLHLNRFRQRINEPNFHHFNDEKLKKLQATSQGLHSLLPEDGRFSYSILLPVTNPRVHYFRACLESIFNQAAMPIEILIGVVQPLEKKTQAIIAEFQQRYPNRLKVFSELKVNDRWKVIHNLVQESKGQFLFLMGDEDWMRPDLLYRYELVLRLFSHPEKMVLYCDWNHLSRNNFFVAFSEHRQPSELHFPFLFRQFLAKALLIPAHLWKNMAEPSIKGAEEENLLLQFDLKGASFQHIPLCLYSVRYEEKKLENPGKQTPFLKVLDHYTKSKQLDWQWIAGNHATTARAVPSLPQGVCIQVIIPYKDQKELTLKCVESILKQKDVQVKITAVNNSSSDQSIAEAIEAMGQEVITINEPFNYSRLNNLAVTSTQTAKNCSILLFINNDVELEPQALSEMLRWVDQPQIGMVGCRLNYPDGKLQHGGVNLRDYDRQNMIWEHVEKWRDFEELEEAKTLGIFDAVTAACAMIKRQTFLEVGGFDEKWYPIGYSDTNLALKLKSKGYKSFYTPYAVGIHHESVSRKSSIEDFESSWWLHNIYFGVR